MPGNETLLYGLISAGWEFSAFLQLMRIHDSPIFVPPGIQAITPGRTAYRESVVGTAI